MNPQAQYGYVQAPKRGVTRKALLIGGLITLVVIISLGFALKGNNSESDKTLRTFLTYVNTGKAAQSYALLSDRMKKATTPSDWEYDVSIVKDKYDMKSLKFTKEEKISNFGNTYKITEKPVRITAKITISNASHTISAVVLQKDAKNTVRLIDEVTDLGTVN